jgi:transposase
MLRSDNDKGFVVIPISWVVERTFSWFESYRRLAKDYEFLNEGTKTMIQISMMRLMLKRIK